MRSAALITWLVTIGGGLLMFVIWLTKGGLRQVADDGVDGHTVGSADRPETVLRPWQLGLHATLALSALLFFVLFIGQDEPATTGYDAAPWMILGMLALAAAVGISMAVPWGAARKRRRDADGPTPQPAEQHIPAVVVAAHGLAAIATVVLVVLVVLE